MTNTLHRQGKPDALQRDYVIFATTAKGINKEGAAPKLQEFMRICQRHHPINMGDGKRGNILQDDIDVESLIATQEEATTVAAVFTDVKTLGKVVGELVTADLGLSINVSGLLDGVQTCCRQNGIERHSVEHSLGFWGATDRLPERETLEVQTLCGHGMVSFGLIRKMVEQVKLRRLTPEQAARTLGKCCECGVFNTVRAQELLEQMGRLAPQ